MALYSLTANFKPYLKLFWLHSNVRGKNSLFFFCFSFPSKRLQIRFDFGLQWLIVDKMIFPSFSRGLIEKLPSIFFFFLWMLFSFWDLLPWRFESLYWDAFFSEFWHCAIRMKNAFKWLFPMKKCEAQVPSILSPRCPLRPCCHLLSATKARKSLWRGPLIP